MTKNFFFLLLKNSAAQDATIFSPEAAKEEVFERSASPEIASAFVPEDEPQVKMSKVFRIFAEIITDILQDFVARVTYQSFETSTPAEPTEPEKGSGDENQLALNTVLYFKSTWNLLLFAAEMNFKEDQKCDDEDQIRDFDKAEKKVSGDDEKVDENVTQHSRSSDQLTTRL